MTKTQTRRLLAALGIGTALTLAAATSFGAQTAPRGLPENPSDSQVQQDRGQDNQGYRPYAPRDRDVRAPRGGNRLERRLAFLHQRLGIRADQERAWNAVAAEVRSEAQQMRERFQDFRERRDADRDNGPREPTVLQRLERRRALLENQSERLERVLAAMQPLYDSLDQNQRRIADRLLFRAEAFGTRGRFAGRGGPAARGRFGGGYDGLRYGDSARGFRGGRPDGGGFGTGNGRSQDEDGQPPQ
jgi:LTXXQ motif family protein